MQIVIGKIIYCIYKCFYNNNIIQILPGGYIGIVNYSPKQKNTTPTRSGGVVFFAEGSNSLCQYTHGQYLFYYIESTIVLAKREPT